MLWKNLGWKYHLTSVNFQRLTDIDPTFILKDGRLLYIPMIEKCDTTTKLCLPKSVKDHRAFYRMVNFQFSVIFCQRSEKHIIPIYELQKMKNEFLRTKEDQNSFHKLKRASDHTTSIMHTDSKWQLQVRNWRTLNNTCNRIV